ncbi:trafficking protein particle complex subunit brun isoform X2 [Rhodnius prolixus]|uniref:trafficking protein particle complex subunit brun isoform X2 n=1 Tax=Rhodnius prolixus TaxID=13249 RepID=UPI003D18C9A0
MRSAVSVILSSPLSDPNMSHPDYEQTYHHHATLLILVKHLGEEFSNKSFMKVFDRINKVNHVKIIDSVGITRNIWARYVKDYPVGNNDWGDFQTHRRLLGLITVGKCKTQVEFNEICRVHESYKVKYTSTLYDARSIVFGINDGPNTPTLTPPSNFKSRALYFATDGEESTSLENNISEFLSSLFWVLESKRHERSREKIERVQLLVAPFERRDLVGLDMESRSIRKRSFGRMTKHLGDLCLQAGLYGEAISHYNAAADNLRAVNDWLWIASACEGLSAASMCVRYPHALKSQIVQRNASLQETNKSRSNHNKTISGTEILEPSSLILPRPNNVLSHEDICKNYREAIIHYSKYQHAGVIEIEVCFKAARVAIELNMVLQAASFLQSIVFINLNLPEDEKIQKLMTLSDLYTKLGFRRKASFYQRLAATYYVSARNPNTDWDQCYNLMLQSLSGHGLTLDPSDYQADGERGWGRLQKQVLQDIVGAAKRVGHSSLATRHMTLLLQVMWNELTPAERHECALQLQNIAAQCEGSPIPLVLDTGLVIPPANLIHIPTAENFQVHKLKPHQQPIKLEKIKEDYGPFLFTPLNFGSMERKTSNKDYKLNYLWVAEEECEVKIELTNPLPFELEVSNMRLLTNGVVFETLPLTVTLPPEVSRYPVTLSGTPKEVGELEILGYSTHTLGVKSNCRLKTLPKIPHSQFTIEVVPALPHLQATLKMCGEQEQTISLVSLYAGESAVCELVLENVGNRQIELIEVSVDSSLDSNILNCNTSELEKQLPLVEGAKIVLPLKVFAAANFINTYPADGGSIRSSLFSGTNSYPSLSSFKHGLFDHLTTPTPSFRSGPSSLNSLNSQFNRLNVDNSIKGAECRIKVKYSGKPGIDAGYCRVASLSLHVDIINSILISNWDVLPAETSSHFYMVLDVMNMTNQEVEVKYTENKSILIEEGESCRVPIPVERCPLSKIGQYFQSEDSIKEIVDLNTACSEHIASLVEVTWLMGNRQGKATLKGITLSSHMLDIVRMSPINWDIWLNVSENGGSGPFTVTLGECIQARVIAHNSLSRSLTDLALSVHIFQDYQNGTCNFNLDTRLAIAGPSHLYLPKVEELGSAKMEWSVVFFNPGQYKMSVQCTSQGKHTWKLVPPIEFDVQDS